MAWILFAQRIQPPEWHKDAACREHPELSWFPTRGDTRTAQAAVCRTCLVRAECAEAGAQETEGIWAGVAARRLRRERQTAA